MTAGDFDHLKDIRYFEVAAVGPVPASVRASTSQMLEDRMKWAMASGPETASDRIALKAEKSVRALMGTSSGKSFIGSSAMGALDAVLQTLPLERGSIVCGRHEYPGLVDAAKRISLLHGLELVLVDASPGELPDLLSSVDAETRVVLVSQVHWLTGHLADLESLASAKRKHGFFFAVDASQGLPVVDLRPDAIEADMVVAAGYKWLAGSLGSAIVHLAPNLVAKLESRLAPDFWPVVPSTQSYVAMHNLASSIEWLLAFGREKAARASLDAAKAVREAGLSVGWTPLGGRTEQNSGIVSFPFGAARAEKIVAAARAEGLFVSARGEAIRVSPHFTASIDECREAVGTIKKISSTIES